MILSSHIKINSNQLEEKELCNYLTRKKKKSLQPQNLENCTMNSNVIRLQQIHKREKKGCCK